MTWTNQVFPAHYHVYEILGCLGDLVNSYLGVGVQEGECVAHVVANNPMLTVSLCDTWGATHGGTNRGNADHVLMRLKRAGHRGAVQILTGYSQEIIPTLDPGASFDLIYVDGDHSEQPALDDLRNCWPRCRWAMVVHDVHMFPVWSALTRFLAEGSNAEEAQVVYCNAGTGTAVVYRRYGR